MIELIVLVFIVAISAILGIFTYQNNRKSATNLTFVTSAISIIFWSIVMYLSVNTPDLTQTLFYIRLSMLAGTIMAISFLLLAITFPQPSIPLKKIWLFIILFMGLITCIIAMSPYMFTDITAIGNNIEPVAGPGIAAFMLTSIGSNIATFVVLISKFIKSRGRLKEQLRFIVFGTLAMFSLLIIANFYAVIILKTSSFIFLGPLFTLLFLASVAYAILKHKLLDIRLLAARAVSYTLMLALIVGLEALILWIATKILPPSIDQTIVAFGGSILIVLGYGGLKSFVTKISDSIFFQGRYDEEVLLKQLTSIMVSEMDIKFLELKLIKLLTAEMKVKTASFVLLSDFVTRPAETLRNPSDSSPNKFADLSGLIHKVKTTLVFEDLTDEAQKELFRKLDISIILPLVVGDTDIGLFVLGPKLSGDMYSDSDLEFLEIFAPQAAIALKNADSYRQIQEFNQTLELKVVDRTHELEEAQAAQLKLKDEFVFIATHDLATPVTAISGFTAMINQRKESISPELKSNLEAITEASSRLRVLVNDLLQVARSDSGTIKVELTQVDAASIIKSALRQAGPSAQEKKVQLIESLAVNNMIQADPKKLAEIVENLVSNGIKYNKEGGSLTVTTVDKVKSLIIEFKDTGLGIPTAEQSKVFTKFFRSEEAEVRQRPGTGLGLFVVRMLTEKMGGKITFKSTESVGTTFWLEFTH